ncbi:DUF2062 domain-containing protein [Desulforamulus profundi]|uniref:DUF2062 domain-containing protein n=1 Tax=Desulforamulus profundi TaxID=1383067 RepID=UPI000BFFAFDB|nr:DUF2062 domain-containing protein [Desulforamulus profundi]
MALNCLPIPIVNIPLSFIIAKFIKASAVAAPITVCLFKAAFPLYFTFNILTGKIVAGNLGSFPVLEIVDQELSLVSEFVFQIKLLGITYLIGSMINFVWIGLLTTLFISV